MHMTFEKAKSKGLIGSVSVFLNGKKREAAIEFMTGDKGFVLSYENPLRIVGDELAKIQEKGKVTAIVNGEAFL